MNQSIRRFVSFTHNARKLIKLVGDRVFVGDDLLPQPRSGERRRLGIWCSAAGPVSVATIGVITGLTTLIAPLVAIAGVFGARGCFRGLSAAWRACTSRSGGSDASRASTTSNFKRILQHIL